MTTMSGPSFFCVIHYCSAKGFSISAEPSTGFNNVIVGPRKTTSPRVLICGSGSRNNKDKKGPLTRVSEREERQYLELVPRLDLKRGLGADRSL